ncbi:MAG: TIGR02757 family protein [Thermodesulfobacteriota bacterium]
MDQSTPSAIPTNLGQRLEALYASYNQRCYVSPDPLEVLYHYPDIRDREIMAFIAAALAYGNVGQILNSIGRVRAIMGAAPLDYVVYGKPSDFTVDFTGFKHRFAAGGHMAAMLVGLKCLITEHGSLQNAFAASFSASDSTCLPALDAFVTKLRNACAQPDPGHLIALPRKGSACKRLLLFLRWMVRNDAVDPGGWEKCPAEKLVVPLDTHMFRVCRTLNLTRRKQPNMKTALEITTGFARIMPADPVRYDFVLTRQGIRRDQRFAIDRN